MRPWRCPLFARAPPRRPTSTGGCFATTSTARARTTPSGATSPSMPCTTIRRTRKPISEMAHLLENVPPSRVYEEMQKLLLSGHAATSLRQLRSEGLHRGLLPLLDVIFEQPMGERFVTLALEQTDGRVSSGKSVSPAFLFAALLWHEVLAAWKKAEQRGLRPIPALFEAMDAVLEIQSDKLAIPRRFTAIMKEIWALQPRFEQRSGRRPFALL